MLSFTPLEEFAAVDEPGAEPLGVSSNGGVVIPAGGDILVYGRGGSGKTTLVIDLMIALAAGESWLDIVEPVRPLRVLVIENEGPRPELRLKLRRKLDHQPTPLDGRIAVLEDPWGRFTFANGEQRQSLAEAIVAHSAEIVVVGPLSRVGMEGGGTLDEITRFVSLIGDVRERVGWPFAVLIVHHDNRAGQVSGAWEGSPDTLIQVSGRDHGHTRLYWQKARWASDLHGTTTELAWAPGESFTVAKTSGQVSTQQASDEDIAGQLLAAVRDNPGAGWSAIEEATPGVQAAKRRAVRDTLFAAGRIVNLAAEDGRNVVLAECPPRKRSSLYVADHPALENLRPASDADETQDAATSESDLRPASRPYKGRRDADADPDRPSNRREAA